MSAVKSTERTMQVRCYMTDPPEGYGTSGVTYQYYNGVTARRAAELAAGNMAATCTAVDYFEVIDDCYDYDSPAMLVADWMGRPAPTFKTRMCEAARSSTTSSRGELMS